MNRLYAVALSLAILLICCWSASIASEGEGETLCIPVGDITIKAPDAVEAKRSAVEFPHALHFGYACQTCHHAWENDENLSACMDCHDQEEPAERDTKGEVDPEEAIMYYKAAYHKLCITCHKDIKQGNQALAASGKILKDKLPATGPVSCIGCHPKE